MDHFLKNLKPNARKTMSLTSPSFWLVALGYLLLTSGVTLLFNLFVPAGEGTFFLFLTIALTFYGVLIDFGYTLWCLWTHRMLNPGADALIQGFSVAGRVIWLHISIFLRVFCWTFGLVFACIFATTLITGNPFAGAVAAMPVAYIAMYVFSLRYKLAPYLLADFPDLGPGVAIHRSVQLTRGWKMQWFRLDLSFLGWILLNALLETAAFVAVLTIQADVSSLLTLDVAVMAEQILQLSVSPLSMAATFLITIPLQMYFLPYRGVSFAGFYDERLQQAIREGYVDPFGSLVSPV